MPIPVEAKSFTYTPDCLEGKEGAPVFTLRYGTRRDRHTYQDEVRLRSLRNNDAKDFEQAIIEELRAKYTSEVMPIDEVVDAIERYYLACEMLTSARKEWANDCLAILSEIPEAERDKARSDVDLPPAPELDFDKDEQERVENLIADVEAKSSRIGRMHRDNGRRERELPRIALSIVLQSTTLDLAIPRNLDGVIEPDTIYALEEALEAKSIELGLDRGESFQAFNQLANRALSAFFLQKDEEKNSSSPPPTISDPNGSTELDSEASISKASAQSPTPKPSSAKQTLV